MRNLVLLLSLVCVACSSVAASGEPGSKKWVRHNLPGYSASVQMPCSSKEIFSKLLPVEVRVACRSGNSVYVIALDDREIIQILKSFEQQGKYVVSPFELSGSDHSFSASPATENKQPHERHAFVALPDGKTAWVMYMASSRESAAAGQDPEPTDASTIERFFDSVEIAG